MLKCKYANKKEGVENMARKNNKKELKKITNHLTPLVDTYYIYGNEKLDQLVHWTNDCYNEVNYLIRQKHFKNIRQFKHQYKLYTRGKLQDKPKYGKEYTATDLTRILKKQSEQGQDTLYRDCINIKISNSIVKNVKNVWSNYYKARGDYKRHPYKYPNGEPRIPGYLKKGKRHAVELDNQTIKIKGKYIVYDRLNLKVKMSPNLYEAAYSDSDDPWLNKLEKIRRIRTYWIKPIVGGVKLCATYFVSSKPLTTYKGKPVPKRISDIYVGADPGVDNLVALVTNNWDFHPLLINGKGIKSVNQYYNKQASHLRHTATQYKQKGFHVKKKDGTTQWIYRTGKSFEHLAQWRNDKILTAIHKATDRIVEYAINCGAEKIFIGRNKYWKNGSNMGRKNNQNFISIPHYRVVQMLTYKAQRYGIEVVAQPEAYTSQTSFLDCEKPCWKNGNNGRKKRGLSPYNRRKKRGMFITNDGYMINADVNGALQIMSLGANVFCDRSNLKQIVGCVSHPHKWSPNF